MLSAPSRKPSLKEYEKRQEEKEAAKRRKDLDDLLNDPTEGTVADEKYRAY